jgi:ubiquitin-conjugating enzyme E2 H
MFDLINIFDIFLPQLLLYPNPTSPLNTIAATLLIESPEKYQTKVRENVQKYCILQEDEQIMNKNFDGLNEKNQIEKNEKENEIEEELSPISSLSQISELSKTSNIELLE